MKSFKKILQIIIIILSFTSYSQKLIFFSNEVCSYNEKALEQNFQSIKSGFIINLDTNEFSMVIYTKSNKQNPVVTKFNSKQLQTDDESTVLIVKVDDDGKTDKNTFIQIEYITKSLFYFSNNKITLFKFLDPDEYSTEW